MLQKFMSYQRDHHDANLLKTIIKRNVMELDMCR